MDVVQSLVEIPPKTTWGLAHAHLRRHEELHCGLEELILDWAASTASSQSHHLLQPVSSLIQWSADQLTKSTEGHSLLTSLHYADFREAEFLE